MRVLRNYGHPIGSATIAREIEASGFYLSDRTIRLYLQEMEREGLVAHARRGRHGGRTITELGIGEIKDALVMERVGFTAAKVDTLAWKISFDLASKSGLVVLNVSLIRESCLRAAINEIIPVFRAGLSMGEYLYLGRSGEEIGEFQIPPGYVAIGTVCTVTLNGVLLSARIPTDSRFGGMLEVQNRTPIRFTDVIYYDGTSLDPLEIFIKGGLTSVREAVRTGHGRIGVSFREVPTAAMAEVEKVLRRMDQIGLGGVLMIGRPSQPVLDFPVQEGRTAILLIGGLNPLAAVEEAGMPTTNFALCTLFEFQRLIHYSEIR
ncbi:MAG TPA: NrpR regulatory domain-containing protein [bacterium]|nr:NrpR regulatory domain-containing protein [bacterium]HQL63479.1 NrpR regulatory domain-containing protein [bacterium]